MFHRFFAPIGICVVLLTFASTISAKHSVPSVRTSIPDRVQTPYVGAITVDAASGKVLFEDNADSIGYPASVQKIMTLYVILDKVSQGAVKLDESVPVTVEASKIGGSQVYLDPREHFPVEDLLYALIVHSANDAAVALVSHVAGNKESFVDLMNKKAEELGMKNTKFHSVHGLPPTDNQEPDVTTARDLAILGRALVLKHPEALKYTSTKVREFRDGKFIMRNHDHLLATFTGCDGLKTGYFKQAGYSIVATAMRNNMRVVTVILGADKGLNPMRPYGGRDSKAAELMNKGFAALAAQSATKPQGK